ncbi:NADPH-dependent FMN reductase [Paenibacillus doosanensis]|uniref:NADPH-dependent FMN reductase n=1 Tax=Paenibacillus doosanensis TaxID=1229154 RepID=UPI0021807B40|nr:NADPH-dependent FMN reductase [Paenibacillus doosanensis]MCS7464804.1 NADPH-dependent FMN reductase [Paenibacillus doosanensis]
MSKVTVISGSPSASSRLNGVLQAVQTHLNAASLDIATIDVRNLPPEDLIYTNFESPAIVTANQSVAEADAVIVATPIYKASYTGVIKTFLDLIPQKGLEGKVIFPVAIGGTIAHLLALEYALKPVLAALGARTQLTGVFALDSQVKRNEDGSFELAEELEQRLAAAAREFIREIELRLASRNAAL